MVKKVAIVTGANRGLGFETSSQLASRGIQVILASRDLKNGELAQKKLAKLGLEVTLSQLDITNLDSIQKMIQFTKDKFGRLDILVNNAGVFKDSGPRRGGSESALDTKLETLKSTFETNVYGTFLMCQHCIPLMKANNYGRIVNVSSGMGQLTDMSGHFPAYRISKTAVNAITRIFSDETKESNILVNSVCPGWVRTDMGGPNATRPLDEGANGIVWLATLEDSGPRGGFFRDRKPIPW